MKGLNSIIIEGILTKDVVLQSTVKGGQVCNFSIAYSHRLSKVDSGFEEGAYLFNVEAWGRLAQTCADLGHKGRGVVVVGRLKEDRWVGEDDKVRSKVIIVAEHMEFRMENRG